MMDKIKSTAPLILFLIMMAIFAYVLSDNDRDPSEIHSQLIGRAAPDFTLERLDIAEISGNPTVALGQGKPVLVNFFASWCVPCRAEHDALMALKEQYNVTIIGISYKDKPAASAAFLQELGNPYSDIYVDIAGRTGIDWGITGVPETFLIGADGTVLYRHFGPIIGDGLEARLLPKYKAAVEAAL